MARFLPPLGTTAAADRVPPRVLGVRWYLTRIAEWLLGAFLLMCVPRVGLAQWVDVWFTPAGGSQYTVGQELIVTIEFCGQDGFWFDYPGSAEFNGGSANFNGDFGSHPGCDDYASITGSITLEPGTNSLKAIIGGSSYWETTEYYVAEGEPPPDYSVSVTPNGGGITRGAFGSYSESFTVQNIGNQTTTYSFTQLCSGAAVTNCSTPSPVTLGPGASTTVGVDYSTGTYSTTGEVRLRASSNGEQDDGWKSVTISGPPPPPTDPEPIVTLTPSHVSLLIPSNTVEVSIWWCQQEEGTWETQTVKNHHPGGTTDLTSSFVDDSWMHSAPANCQGPNDYWEHWSGTITIEPGLNQIEACARTYQDVSGCDLGVYKIVPKYRSVFVSAAAQQVEVRPGSTGNVQAFTVTNTGDWEETFNIGAACTGLAPTSCGAASPAQMMLGSGQSATATVTYAASATLGDTGHIDVTATLVGASDVTSSSWTEVFVTAAPSPGVTLAGMSDAFERDLCLTVSAGSGAAAECGDLRVAHALPSVRTMNTARTPTLIFNSQHANPFPIVRADVTLPSGDPLPTTLQATLYVGGDTAQQSWNGSDWGAPGQTRRIAIGIDASSPSWTTGLYTFQLEVRRITGGSNTHFQTISGELPVVKRIESPFGAGWWLAGLERIYFGSGIAWIGGDGSTRFYHAVSANLWMASNVDRPDSITFDGTYYHRHLPNNLKVRFNTGGYHVATINRLGHTTSFSYATVGGRTVVSSLSVPTVSGSVSYIFHYNGNGQLDSVSAPGPTGGTRTTTLAINTGNGRIESITDPDTTTVSFGYDPTHVRRMTSRTDRRSYTTSYFYDGGGRLTQSSLPLPGGVTIAHAYRPVETIGLVGVTSPLSPDSTYSRVDGPRTDVTDVAKFWFTRAGMVSRTRDPLGRETRVVYGNASFPALATEVRDPTRFVTRSWYSPRGLVDSTIAIKPLGTEANSKRTYQWHSTWAAPTLVVSPTGETVSFDYDGGNGNRLWQQPGPHDSTRVWFTYTASGMLESVAVPGTNPEWFTYDGVRGNLASQTGPNGAIDSLFTDSIGRDTLLRSPIEGSAKGWTRTAYDIVDQVRKTVTFGPAMLGAVADSVVVEQEYDDEGNLTHVKRHRGVYFAGYGALVSTFDYDGAGRKKTATGPGSSESFGLDLGGNVTTHTTANGTVTMVYDAAGQLTRRIVPQVIHDGTPCASFFTTESCFYTFPTRGGPTVCLSADTANFRYDAAGRITAADNIHARVRRAYTRSGLLSAETQAIRSYYSDGSHPCEGDPEQGWQSMYAIHTASLSYGYDLAGRRTSLTHPFGTQIYSYDSSGSGRRGLLTGVTDIGSRTYTIRYDAAGRVRVVHYPGTVDDSLFFNASGQLENRTVTGVLNDGLAYDLRGRITSATRSGAPTAITRYSGLGAVVSALDHGSASGWEEMFRVDALGNRLRRQQNGTRPPEHPDNQGVRFSAYDAHGRVESVVDTLLPGTDPYVYEEYYHYDNAGNTHLTFLRETDFYGSSGTLFDAAKSYYRADGKLGVYNRHIGLGPISDDSRARNRGVYEEYRYDALGRRVLVRSRRGSLCDVISNPVACSSYIERIFWDGDQILIENRANGADSLDSGWLDEQTSTGAAYGRVIYTHAMGIDQPLSVSKDGVALMPHADWRGQYAAGTLANGTVCGNGTGCPVVEWPGAKSSLDGEILYPTSAVSWWGNLITGKADGSGMQYMRNRYYDPKTGRFTQGDPIGLAGGLNLYGYANGDPVNFSDPFGLCPEKPWECPGMAEERERLIATVDKPLESAGLADPTALIGGMQVRGAKATITIGREAFRHVVKRHAFWSVERNVSRFNAGENIGKLIRASEGVARSPARGGRFQRVVDAGREVGVDRATGKPTSFYTVITDAKDNLVTTHPGLPR